MDDWRTEKRYIMEVLAYLLPTFALGFVWHLVLFQPYYDALAVYRRDIIIPFGFRSMLIQAAIFAWVYEKRSRRRADACFLEHAATVWVGRCCRGALRRWRSRPRT
jgi:hypothetical protein